MIRSKTKPRNKFNFHLFIYLFVFFSPSPYISVHPSIFLSPSYFRARFDRTWSTRIVPSLDSSMRLFPRRNSTWNTPRFKVDSRHPRLFIETGGQRFQAFEIDNRWRGAGAALGGGLEMDEKGKRGDFELGEELCYTRTYAKGEAPSLDTGEGGLYTRVFNPRFEI